jgi:hypothetical protein
MRKSSVFLIAIVTAITVLSAFCILVLQKRIKIALIFDNFARNKAATALKQ